MRDIKFRAWDKEKKEMINCFDSEKSSKVVALYLKYSTLDLMQYTGLKDKNGKEIYEGDILKPICPQEFQLIIEFENGNFWGYYEHVSPENYEIIGNIYENHELLK